MTATPSLTEKIAGLIEKNGYDNALYENIRAQLQQQGVPSNLSIEERVGGELDKDDIAQVVALRYAAAAKMVNSLGVKAPMSDLEDVLYGMSCLATEQRQLFLEQWEEVLGREYGLLMDVQFGDHASGTGTPEAEIDANSVTEQLQALGFNMRAK